MLGAPPYINNIFRRGTPYTLLGTLTTDVCGLNKELITECLNSALLTAEESATLVGVEGWRELDDPLLVTSVLRSILV